MNKDFILEHFCEINGQLHTKKSWSRRTLLGRTPKKVIKDNKTYKNEDILWILRGGEIPDGMTVRGDKLVPKYALGGRPTGSKSSYKRKNTLSVAEERELASKYSTISRSEILQKYNISEGQLLNIKKKYGFKSKTFSQIVKGSKTIKELTGICGVYAIVREDNTRGYVGSSKNIGKRIEVHIKDLNNDRHFSKDFQDDWGKHNFYLFLLRECTEMDLLKEENEFLTKLDKYCYYNKVFPNESDIDYPGAYKKIMDNCTFLENGCIEYNSRPLKNGYVWIKYDGHKLQTHRVSYYANFGKTSNLVNHKCLNKKCCNPEHLSEESSSGNAKYSVSMEEKGSRSSLYERKDEIAKLIGVKSYREIIEELDLKVNKTTLWTFVKKVFR